MAKSESEEVSLLELVAGFLAALKRNLLLSILLPLAGMLIALLVSYNSQDVFESSLLVETSLLSENESKFLFDQLNKIGTIPGISGDDGAKLSGFSYKVYTAASDDELNEKSVYLEATARVSDRNVFPALQKALLNVINEYPPIARHRSEREKYYSELIARIDSEIQAMENVKKQISGNVQATYLNPSELYANSVKLYKDKLTYELRRNQIRSIHVIKSFDTLTVDARSGPLLAVVVGFSVGFAVLCLLLFIQYFVRYMTVYETTH
jgi:hypothetical protein